MASSVLAIGNDSGLVIVSAGRCMGKVPPNPNTNTNSTPYSNSNPQKKKLKKKELLHHKTNGGGGSNKDLPEVRQTEESDDRYSFVQKPIEVNRNMEFNSGDFVTYDVGASSKSELADLRKKMVLELEQIRNLRGRIELSVTPKLQGKPKKLSGNKRSDPISSDKMICNGSVDVVMDEGLMKECKQILNKLMNHKCGWVFSTPVDTTSLGLHDYHQIVNHPMDLGTVRSNLLKNMYQSPLVFASDVRLTFNNAMLYNPKIHEVHQWAKMLLSRFEELFRPIQEKASLARREHFNGGGGGGPGGGGGGGVVEELQGSSWNQFSTTERVKKPKLSPKAKRMQSQSSASTMPKPQPQPQPQPTAVSSKANSPVVSPSPKTAPPSKTPRAPKLPKPKAKDPNKREMSVDEKHKLGFELQNLPQEKLPQLVHIIRKRNEHLAQDGDEIELDIEALDTETLWELDRFVTYWKKMVSKSKRQALMMNNSNHAAPDASTADAELDDKDVSNVSNVLVKEKKDEIGDQEDDIPASNLFAVDTEKDDPAGLNSGNGDEYLVSDIGNPDDDGQGLGNGDNVVGHAHGNGSSSSSSTSSSSTGSSSSSGSGSGSSSGSDDSDADDAQS